MARVTNKLIRQITRHLGDADAAEKMAALAALLNEKPELYSDYQPLLQGFSAFLESVQEAYKQYEDKNKIAIRNLQLSSDELNKVNRKLEFLNSSMNAMLESLGQGLLFFDRDGLCSPVFSKSCHYFLETNPAGKYIWDILALSQAETDNLKTLMRYILDNDSALSFDDLMSLAPRTKTHSDGKSLHIEYRPMRAAGTGINGILVIVTDRTKEEETRKLLEEKEKTAGRVLRLAKNRNGFQQLVQNLHGYFLDADHAEYKAEESIRDIQRMVHTLKGLAGTFFADDIAGILHEMEDDLSSAGDSIAKAKKIIDGYKSRIAESRLALIEQAESLFGLDYIAQGETKVIPHDKLQAFYALLSDGKPHSDIAEIFTREFMTVPIREELEQLDYQIQEIASRLGKKIAPAQFEGDNFSIPDAPYTMFFNTLVHIARNIVDHGIEPADIRQMLSKPQAGQIILRTEAFSLDAREWFRITIEDDGSGINKETVRQRLTASGTAIDKLNDKDLLQQIFQPGFSTRDIVSDVSGRGVGLNAVYEEVTRLGGKIMVESQLGHFTRFVIELPMMWHKG